MTRVTLDDVAGVAGVSRATASRALTGSGSVSQATREKVQAAAGRLAFTPHQAARALASSQTQAIALVIPEPDAFVLADPFLSGVIMGVSETFHATRYQMILVIARPDDPVTKVSRVLRPDYVDGAIVVSQHGTGHLSRVIAANEVPVVFVGRPWDEAVSPAAPGTGPEPGGGADAPDAPPARAVAAEPGDGVTRAASTRWYVDVDNRRVGQLATRHLVARGARRIACIAGPADMTPVQDRSRGWRETLEAAGLEPGPVTHAPFTFRDGEASLHRILATDPAVDAIFAQSDLMAAGAMRALAAAGIAVPDQMRVVGVDDTEISRATSPTLTTVTNPAGELSCRASRMLLRVLGRDDATAIGPEIIVPHLVVRESA